MKNTTTLYMRTVEMIEKGLKAYPKIHHLGTKFVTSIFDEPVEVTEKVDGSQFVFGRVNSEILFRSKGAQIHVESAPKQFQTAVDTVLGFNLPDDYVFYCEYLSKPKHNVLNYQRVPDNHLVLFGVSNPLYDEWVSSHDALAAWAERFGIDVAPCLFYGSTNAEEVIDLLDHESFLGGPKVEGVVVKNYKDCFVADRVYPVMAAKFVSEVFKETHDNSWKKEHSSRGKWDAFKERYRSEARWRKAVQHLRDDDVLVEEPRDIGALIAEVKRDITEEEIEAIKDFLWREFGSELLRRSTAGLPEWYKKELACG